GHPLDAAGDLAGGVLKSAGDVAGGVFKGAVDEAGGLVHGVEDTGKGLFEFAKADVEGGLLAVNPLAGAAVVNGIEGDRERLIRKADRNPEQEKQDKQDGQRFDDALE